MLRLFFVIITAAVICTHEISILEKIMYLFLKDQIQVKVNIPFRYILLLVLKGYLRYKKITSKMCHLRHRLRIFLFCRKFMFRSQDTQVFVFLTIL